MVMGKISEIFNFDNIGGKIKNLAKWSCWITILLIWIAAPIAFIALAVDDWTVEFCWIPLVGAIVGPVFVWIGSWVTYAFGEYIEDTKSIRYNTAIIAQPIRNAEAEKASQKGNKKTESPKPEVPKPTPIEKGKIVPARTDMPSHKTYAEGEYVSGRTYYSGDKVIFEGKKYVCTAQNSTVWSPGVAPSQWQECSPSETEL